jgi:hypothetical protein
VLGACALAPPPADARRPATAAATARGAEAPVTVTVPLVAVLGVAMFVAYRYLGLRAWQAVLCLLCGVLLAATTAAPGIRHALTAAVQWLTGH